MGVIDEHWCSQCGKSMDKKKDRYVEVDFINDNKTKAGKPKKKKSDKHNRAFLCEDCFSTDPDLKKKFGEIRLKGNPNFIATIDCKHWAKCETYEFRNKNVRCKHIAVIDDKIYCKRRHPGVTKLNQEKSKLLEQRALLMQEIMKDVLGGLTDNPQMEKIMNRFLTEGGMKSFTQMAVTTPVTPEVVIEEIDPDVEKRLEKEGDVPNGWKRSAKDQYENYCKKCEKNNNGLRSMENGGCGKSIGVASRDGCDGTEAIEPKNKPINSTESYLSDGDTDE